MKKKIFYFFSLILMLCLTLLNIGFSIKANAVEPRAEGVEFEAISISDIDLNRSAFIKITFNVEQGIPMENSCLNFKFSPDGEEYFSYNLTLNNNDELNWYERGLNVEFGEYTEGYIDLNYEIYYDLFNVNFVDESKYDYKAFVSLSFDFTELENFDLSIDSFDESVYGLVEQMCVDQSPVVNGEAGYVTNINNPVSVTKIKEGISAWDNEDGDLTSSIIIEKDNYSDNNKIPGTYTIQFSVTDSSDNTAYLTVTVLVADTDEPEIELKNEVIELSYTHEFIDVSTFEGLAIIKDLFIGKITDNHKLLLNQTYPFWVYIDGYDEDSYSQIGTYEVMFEVVDESDNMAVAYAALKVVDDVAPVFSGPTTIVKNINEILTLEDIKAQLSATDVYDGLLTSAITVDYDNYTGYANKKGTYTIEFGVTDNSGNVTTHTVTISVLDNIPPVFYIDSYFIQVSQLEVLTNEQIVDLLIASGQITASANKTVKFVVNSYKGHESEVGTYPIQLQVRGSDGSEDVINLAVKVVEDDNIPGEDDVVVEGESEFIQFVTQEFWFGWQVWIWLLIAFVLAIFIIVGIVSAAKSNSKPIKYSKRRW